MAFRWFSTRGCFFRFRLKAETERNNGFAVLASYGIMENNRVILTKVIVYKGNILVNLFQFRSALLFIFDSILQELRQDADLKFMFMMHHEKKKKGRS